MEYEQKEIIYDYFKLDMTIRNKENKLKRDKKRFYNQNFHGTTDFDDPKGVRRKGFSLETDMINFLDNVNMVEGTIQKLKCKNKHFKRFLKGLDYNAYSSLERRYRNKTGRIENIQTLGSDRQVIEEILEIEEAICYKYNENQELLEQLRLAIAPFNDDTVEESFDSMLNMLGV